MRRHAPDVARTQTDVAFPELPRCTACSALTDLLRPGRVPRFAERSDLRAPTRSWDASVIRGLLRDGCEQRVKSFVRTTNRRAGERGVDRFRMAHEPAGEAPEPSPVRPDSEPSRHASARSASAGVSPGSRTTRSRSRPVAATSLWNMVTVGSISPVSTLETVERATPARLPTARRDRPAEVRSRVSVALGASMGVVYILPPRKSSHCGRNLRCQGTSGGRCSARQQPNTEQWQP